MNALKSGSLFSGYGGLDLAVEAVLGTTPAWVSEIDKAASRILETRFPGVPNLGDITAVDWHTTKPVRVLTGGFPCQDVSTAGLRAGMRDGNRSGLWYQMARAIDILRPDLVVIENVRGLLSAEADGYVEPCPWCLGEAGDGEPAMRALGAVLADLASLGYDAAWVGLPASGVGAPHGRFRVFVLAWPADSAGEGLEAWGEGRDRGGDAADAASDPGWLLDRDGGAAAGLGGRAAGVTLLRTPTAQLAVNGGSQHPEKRKAGGHGPPLADEVEHLLPTPRATDGTKGGPNQRGSSGDLMLPSAVTLLPTPTSTDHKASGATYAATDTHHTGTTLTDAVVRGYGLMPTPSVADVEGGRKHRSGARSDELLLNGIAHAQAFGQYAPAIARWEAVISRPAPAPTEPTGKGGAHRLSPRFVEWLMGLPAGWVTDTDTTRNEQLKALGNGVVPQQAAAAVRHLLGIREMALTQEMAS